MQITISGAEEILRRIDQYRNADEKFLEIARKLCAVGEQVASSGFGGNASVAVEPTDHGYKVTISGEDILFIEFGTGNATGTGTAEYDAIPSVVYPGSWSEMHNGEYYRTGGYPKGFWHFGGRKINQTPPHPYTYEAYKAMVEELPKVVNEVFH